MAAKNKKRKLISPTEYARLIGIAQQSVVEQMNKGQIPFVMQGKRKMIDVEAATIARAATLNPSGPGGATSAPKTPTYAEVRTQREAITAKMKELELGKRMGKLVEVDRVKASWYEVSRTVRNSYLALPDRLASILASTTDPGEVHRILSEEINKILEGLANANRI